LVLFFLLSQEFPLVDYKNKTILSISFYFFPVFITLFMGQTSFILAIIFVLIYHFLRLKEFKKVGVLSGLLLVKPQYLLAVPLILFFVKRKREFLSSFVLTVFFLLVLSLLIVGPEALLGYFDFARLTENPEFGNRASQMFSIQAATSYLFFNSNLTRAEPLFINASIYLLSLGLFLKKAKDYSFNKNFVIVVLLVLLFGVHVLNHDLILLIIPIFILLQQVYKGGVKSSLFLLISFLFLIPTASFLGYSIIGTLALLIFALTLLLKKDYIVI
jgi:hypothetical protein